MKLLHLTDIHLTSPGGLIGGRDPNRNFERALDHALTHHPDTDAVFITGDLSDWGDGDDYDRLRARLDAVPIPVHLCIGNHDDRPTFLTRFPALAGDGGFVQHVIDLPIGHAITLDTWGPESHAGFFCAARAAWLDRQLRTLPYPVYLFMHHNPVPIRIAPMDQIMLLDADRFTETLRPHRDKIAHIFHGHCHLTLAGSLLGVPISAPRGTNHQGWPDFAATTHLAAADLTESYAVIFVTAESVMVHMVEFGHVGEVRNEGTPDYADWDRLTMVR